jgi:hypothetical protein
MWFCGSHRGFERRADGLTFTTIVAEWLPSNGEVPRPSLAGAFPFPTQRVAPWVVCPIWCPKPRRLNRYNGISAMWLRSWFYPAGYPLKPHNHDFKEPTLGLEHPKAPPPFTIQSIEVSAVTDMAHRNN